MRTSGFADSAAGHTDDRTGKYVRGGTPVVYLGDYVSWLSEHPTAPPLTLHGEVTRLDVDTVQVYCEELDVLLDVPYREVRRG